MTGYFCGRRPHDAHSYLGSALVIAVCAGFASLAVLATVIDLAAIIH